MSEIVIPVVSTFVNAKSTMFVRFVDEVYEPIHGTQSSAVVSIGFARAMIVVPDLVAHRMDAQILIRIHVFDQAIPLTGLDLPKLAVRGQIQLLIVRWIVRANEIEVSLFLVRNTWMVEVCAVVGRKPFVRTVGIVLEPNHRAFVRTSGRCIKD